jgi:hypothetical protein
MAIALTQLDAQTLTRLAHRNNPPHGNLHADHSVGGAGQQVPSGMWLEFGVARFPVT